MPADAVHRPATTRPGRRRARIALVLAGAVLTQAAVSALPEAAAGATVRAVNWAAPVTVKVTASGQLTSGDLDGDGDLDVFNAARSTVLVNNGTGTLAVAASDGTNLTDVTTGDVDGNGVREIIGGSTSAVVVKKFTPGATPTVTTLRSLAVTTPSAVAATDVDADGDLDLLTVATDGLSLLKGTGTGTFGAKVVKVVDASRNTKTMLIAGDVDGDGKTDVVVTGSNSGATAHAITFLKGSGTGTYTASTPRTLTGATLELVAADVDDDGRLDVVRLATGGKLELFRGTTTGLATATAVATVATATMLTVGDVNHDARPDLIVNSTVAGSLGVKSPTVAALLGTDTTTFGAPVVAAATSTTNGNAAHVDVEAVDLDGDGDTEAVGSAVSDALVAIWAPAGDADSTAPVVAGALAGSPTGPDGDWYTSDVVVTWSTADDDSRITARTGCGPTTVGTDTAGTDVTCTATSPGGTTTRTLTVRRDTELPVVGLVGGPVDGATYDLGTVPAQPTCSAVDATAGLDEQGCVVTGYSSEVGTHTVSAVATDLAGHRATAAATYTVLPVAPGQPRSVSVQPGLGSLQITWAAPSSDGGSPVIDYLVTATPAAGSGAEEVTATVVAPTSELELPDLAAGVTYTVTVTAHNTAGASISAEPVTATTLAAATIGAIADATVVAGTAWTAALTLGGHPTPTVAILDGELPAGLSLTADGTLSGTPTVAGTTVLTLAATNVAGEATTVQTLVVVAAEASQVDALDGTEQTTAPRTDFLAPLTVEVGDDFGNPVAGAEVTFAVESGSAAFAGAAAATAATDEDGIATAPTLTAGRTAGPVVVSATIAGGAQAFHEPVVAPVAPDQAGSLAVSAAVGALEVSWSAPEFDGGIAVEGYSVSATPGDGEPVTAQVGADETSVTLTGLAPGVEHAVTVTVLNTAGSSEPTPPVSATTWALPEITRTAPTTVVAGTDTEFAFTLAGYPAPTAALAEGSLPDGLTLDEQGRLTGTPTVAGTSRFTVTATNSAGEATTATQTLRVLAAAPIALAATGGGATRAAIGASFVTPLSATVTDAYGNPVAGALVTFRVASGSAVFGKSTSAVAVSAASGVAAAPRLTAGKTPGEVVVTSTLAGGASATHTLTVVPLPANLSVSVSGVPTKLARGKSFTATVVVKNAGPGRAALPSVALSVLPGLTVVSATGGGTVGEGATGASWSRTSLAKGASLRLTVRLKVAAVTAPATSGRVTATVTTTSVDPSAVNNTSARTLRYL